MNPVDYGQPVERFQERFGGGLVRRIADGACQGILGALEAKKVVL